MVESKKCPLIIYHRHHALCRLLQPIQADSYKILPLIAGQTSIDIPTLSQWTLIVLMIILACIAARGAEAAPGTTRHARAHADEHDLR